jgi:hypothetical protein
VKPSPKEITVTLSTTYVDVWQTFATFEEMMLNQTVEIFKIDEYLHVYG